RFYHKFFSDKTPVEKGNGYKSLVVRNAGNDCNYTFMRDALIQNLYNGKTNVDCASYQPAVVFINGEYWGIENIRERTNDHYYLANYNLDEDQIDMYDNLTLQNGTEEAYQKLKSLLSGEFTYDELDRLVDMDNFLRYYVLYMFVWNADWPGNNFVFWRPRDGKFRWVLKDLDFGFGLDRGFSGDTSANPVFYMLNPGVISDAWAYNDYNTFLFRRALADKDKIVEPMFIDYYLVILGDLLRENIITNMADSLASNIRNEFPYHSERWSKVQRYTAPNFRSHKAATPEKWEDEILYIKKWVNARIRNVYDSLSAQFNLGDFTPVRVTTSQNLTDQILMNSIKVHYSTFDGKWPIGRPLRVSVGDLSGKYVVKHWEVKTVSGEDTSEAEIITGQELDLTDAIAVKKSGVLVHAVLENVNADGRNITKKLTNGKNVIVPRIIRNELVIKNSGIQHDIYNVEIFDISGKVLKTAVMQSGNLRLNLSGLSSRVILLSVKNGINRQVFKLLL
ncbi:MAG: CotH kinase family protein, partial [Fibrobacter sp.]|nr:CotH kinase family protein [Fibrobacter sp.]